MKKTIGIFIAAALIFSCAAPEGPQEKIVVAYVIGWGDNQVIPDVNYMTHINYAFGKVTDSFDGVFVQNPDRLRMLAGLKAQKPSLKVLLSVGGWGAGNFSEMAYTPERRKAFAEDCLRTVEAFNLDGIDMDWEYPGSSAAGISSDPSDTENFTLLMQQLRQTLGPDRLLTYASEAGARHIDHAAVLPYVDFVNIMSYDMGQLGRYISSALYDSPLTGPLTTDRALKAHLAAGIPASKLTLGLPFYGRGKASEYADYRNFRDIDTTDLTVRWDADAQVPYLVNEAGEYIFNYENPRSIRLKCQYALDADLLGGMYWDYGADDDSSSLRKVVAEMFLGYR